MEYYYSSSHSINKIKDTYYRINEFQNYTKLKEKYLIITYDNYTNLSKYMCS